MRFSDISWWPDQVAHFIESAAATGLGFLAFGNPAVGALTGLVLTLWKEGEDMYYKYKAGKFAGGDVLDLVIHLFGVAIPTAMFYALT